MKLLQTRTMHALGSSCARLSVHNLGGDLGCVIARCGQCKTPILLVLCLVLLLLGHSTRYRFLLVICLAVPLLVLCLVVQLHAA